jgi:hypothetical protein
MEHDNKRLRMVGPRELEEVERLRELAHAPPPPPPPLAPPQHYETLHQADFGAPSSREGVR